MANISGTNIASAVRPFTDEDKYPTAYSNEIKGGNHTVATLLARNAIPKERREIGMTCWVTETNKTYKLINNPVTDATQDSDWTNSVGTSSDVACGAKTLEEKLANGETSTYKDIVFVIETVVEGSYNLEQVFPFNGIFDNVLANIPSNKVLTEDLVVDVQVLNGVDWQTISTVTIPQGQTVGNTAILRSENKTITALQRVRLNIANCQANVNKLVVTVGIVISF